MKMQERRGRVIMNLSIHSDDLTLSLIMHVMCLCFLFKYVIANNRMNVVSVSRVGRVFCSPYFPPTHLCIWLIL